MISEKFSKWKIDSLSDKPVTHRVKWTHITGKSDYSKSMSYEKALHLSEVGNTHFKNAVHTIQELWEIWESAWLSGNSKTLAALFENTISQSKYPVFSASWWDEHGYKIGEYVTSSGLPVSYRKMLEKEKETTVTQKSEQTSNDPN